MNTSSLFPLSAQVMEVCYRALITRAVRRHELSSRSRLQILYYYHYYYFFFFCTRAQVKFLVAFASSFLFIYLFIYSFIITR